jgi:Flp pilus assembly protein TadG
MPRRPSAAADRRSLAGAFGVSWRRARGERGAAAVEFALVLPAFAFLLFGMLDFGRALNYWMTETHLATTGARYAAVDKKPDPSPGVSLQQGIYNQIVTPELKSGGSVSGPTGSAQVCVSFPNGNAPADKELGDPVKVEVKSNFRFMALLGLASVPLTGEATMRLEKASTATAGCFSGP